MSGIPLAARVALLDRWPHLVANERLWRIGRFDDAFSYRWLDQPLPAGAQRWLDRLARAESGPVAEAVRRRRNRRVRDNRLRDIDNALLVNVGPGERRKNSLFVAVAADATRGGAPASALSWELAGEPRHRFGLAESAKTVAEARRIAAAWGPGAKGLVSLRDPTHPARRWFNVFTTSDGVHFGDYSDPEGDPNAVANAHLASIDERFGFPSILLWRRDDVAGQSPIPDDLFSLGRNDAETLLTDLWGPAVGVEAATAALDHIWFHRDLVHARWISRAIERGACTLLPDYLTKIATGAGEVDDTKAQPLTRIDAAMLELVACGRPTMHNGTVEVTVFDSPRARALAESFDGAVIREGAVDGLAPGTIGICIDHRARERLRLDNPAYEAPLAGEPELGRRPPPRSTSWVDTNRAGGPGTRKTNCWNTAAAIAAYLATGAPNVSLPIYRDAPFRPTIPEYLALVGTVGDPVFISSKTEADAVVRSWGPLGQGIVAAAHSDVSTHMFNAFCAADGETVRYLDGHTGEAGDFNFGISWMRIGIVQLEARCHNFG